MGVMVQMQIKIGQVTLRNPVVLAAGTCGVMGEIKDAINLASIGAITTKSITKESRTGNEPTRLTELHGSVSATSGGMMNAIGLANEGIDSFVKNQAPKATSLDTTVIGSIAGHTIDDYVAVANGMNEAAGIELVEINVSCPNTSDGLEFGSSAIQLTSLLNELKPVLTNTGMIVKLSVTPGDLRPHAHAAIECGADAITLINTIPGLAINVETKQPILSRGVGGVSGAVIHPVAVRVIHEIYRDIAKDVKVPIIGTGGIMRWEDAAEFILAGASAVGIGTASFVNPAIAPKIARKLEEWANRIGSENINDLVGALEQ
jgi:dihydroorotate dehydrogenase (NAD+) catalytic subunit